MEPSPKTLPMGRGVFSGFELMRVLGAGSYGVTYEARGKNGQRWAIKEYCPRQIVTRKGRTLVPDVGKERVFKYGYELFENEANTLKRLQEAQRHPNVVRVHGLFTKFGTVYMQMEFIDGRTLGDILESGRQHTDAEITNILGQMTVALGLTHENDILHCDVKPHNIMIRNGSEQAVLIDFGAVRGITNPLNDLTVFTEAYAPIELFPDGPGKVGPWSDLYSLGVVGYQLCVGRKPPVSMVRAKEIHNGRPDPYVPCMQARREGVSDKLAAIVDACMRLYPAERPVDARKMLAMLRSEVDTRDISQNFGRPPAFGQREIGQIIQLVLVRGQKGDKSAMAIVDSNEPAPASKPEPQAPSEEPEYVVPPSQSSKSNKQSATVGLVAGIAIVLVIIAVIINEIY